MGTGKRKERERERREKEEWSDVDFEGRTEIL